MPVKRRLGSWKELGRYPFRTFGLSCPDKELLLVETGMGWTSALQALEWAFHVTEHNLIVSFGFAGGLCEEAQVGSVFLARAFIPPKTRTPQSISGSIRLQSSSGLSVFCREHGVQDAQLITVDRVVPKSKITAPSLEEGISLVDMESYFLAECALMKGLPFFDFRAVSDGVGDEIDYDIGAITDSSGSVRVSRVLLQVIKKPRLAGSFYASWKRSNMAAHGLGRVLSAFLSLPAALLCEIASQIRLVRSCSDM